MTEIVIERGSWRLRGSDSGGGPKCLVFVHGWTCDRTTFEPQIALLSHSYRCVAVDNRGHGLSDPPTDGGYRIVDMADDVGAVIEGLGIERAVLVGHSMGGTVAYEAAARCGDRVAGLVLLHPMPLRHSAATEGLFKHLDGQLRDPATFEETRRGIIDTAMFTNSTDPVLRSNLRTLMLEADADAARGCWTGLTTYGSTHPPMAGLPALVISGERPANDEETLRELLPSAHVMLTESGSFVQLEAPDRVTALIDEFASSLVT